MLKKVVKIAMLLVILPLNLLLPSNNVNDTIPSIPNPKKIHEIMIRGGLKIKKALKPQMQIQMMITVKTYLLMLGFQSSAKK